MVPFRSWAAHPRRRLFAVGSVGLLTVGLLALGPSSTAAAPSAATAVPSTGDLSLLSAPVGFSDVDTRAGSLTPTAAQLATVSSLGATARWNKFGTPESLIKYGTYLGSGTGDAVATARSWLESNAALFKLTAAGVDALTLVADQKLAGAAATPSCSGSGSGHSIRLRMA